jgi:hypothetical protein
VDGYAQPELIPRQRHAHLRLTRAVTPGPRRKRPAKFRRLVKYPDRTGHGAVVRDLALRVVTTHRARTPVLGVDPELVLVLELNREVDPDLIRRAELMVLELASEKVLVAFAGDPELTEFRRRCEAYQQGARPPMETGKPERAAEYEDLFDAIEKLRPLASQDTISEELRRVLESTPVKQTLRLDVQCWCPEVVTEARRRYEEVFQAVVAAGGNVPDRSLRESAGLSMLRVELPAGMVYQLAEVDRVKSIDVLPRPVLTHPQVWNASPEDLPEVLSPSPTATTVAVVDSGVRSAHPLLAPAVIGVEVAGPSLADGGDESGHGTLVASLSLHGSLDQSLSSREPLRPAGRLFSVRVLDANDNFPDTRLWEEHLHDAIMMAVSAGAADPARCCHRRSRPRAQPDHRDQCRQLSGGGIHRR